jgi:hypothetical protein
VFQVLFDLSLDSEEIKRFEIENSTIIDEFGAAFRRHFIPTNDDNTQLSSQSGL